MKKIYLVFTFIIACFLTGCKHDMNYIIENKPSITGIVKEANESSCLIESDESKYVISMDVEYGNSTTNINIGDEIIVYYDGVILESYPMQINKVYAITLQEKSN